MSLDIREERHVVIITGSRDWTDRETIRARLSLYPKGTLVLHGAADGADILAAGLCWELGLIQVPHPFFRGLRRRGGPLRNLLLLGLGAVYRSYGYIVHVEAFPLPQSVGTVHLMNNAVEQLFVVNKSSPRQG